jgi:hypothetical protein
MLVVDLSVGRGNVDLASCVLDPEPGEEKPPGSSYLETCLCTEWTPGQSIGGLLLTAPSPGRSN